MSKIKLYISVIILVQFSVSCVSPRIIIQIKSFYLPSMKTDSKLSLEKLGKNYEKIKYITQDSLVQTAILIRTKCVKTKGTIVLIHGLRRSKEIFIPVSRILSRNGYNSLLVDLRGHGESEGKYCTFGYYEKNDIVTLIDTLQSRRYINKNIGIWGQSLGGAVAIQVLQIDERVKFGIIESSFSDLQTIVDDYFKFYLGFKRPKYSKKLLSQAEKIGKFNSKDIRPSESAKNIKQPVLIVHGKKDRRINYKYGVENYNNFTNKNKEFILIEEGNHHNIWKIGGEEYFIKVLKFIDNNKSYQ